MKNKKLFAILTLVCFMFTLMPVAAFAATTTYDADQVYVKGNGATFETEDEATVKNAFNVRVGDGTTGSFIFYAVDEDGTGVALSSAIDAPTLTINTVGDFEVYAINVAGQTLGDALTKVDTVANKVATLVAWAESLDLIVAGEADIYVDAPDMVYQIVLKPYTEDNYTTSFTAGTSATLNIEASNGFVKNGKVIAELQSKTKNGTDAFAAVKAGYDLTITKAGYVDVDYETLTTDRKGQVVFEVTADLANVGNKVIVKFGKAKAELTVNAKTANVASVALNNEPKAPQNNTNTIESANVEFKFTDANGVAAELVMTSDRVNTTDTVPGTDGVVNLTGSNVAITLVEKPAKSNMKSSDFGLEKQASATGVEADAAGVYTLVCTDTDGKVDKDGTYVIKVAMKNGSSATATVKVAEMGEVVGIMFVKAPTTIAYGETLNYTGSVVAVDANGVIDKTIAPDSVSAAGVAVSNFTTSGALTAQNDEKYIGETITLLAVYGDFTATTDIVVVDKAATIKYLSTEAEVGINTTLVAQIKDANGKVVPIDASTVSGVKMIVLDKPENAVAVATSAIGNALKDGNVLMSFLASAPGEYKVQTVVTYGVNKYISGIETITVGGGMNAFNDVVVVSLGADSMIVNNEVVKLDVAPFIENNRTMMQFNVLYVFGIDVQWVAETQSIVAEGNGIKVVMTLGSKVAVVNGEEVALDVAPYSVNGRTVVPVGFITGVLDITPTFTYNADGSIADILFTK